MDMSEAEVQEAVPAAGPNLQYLGFIPVLLIKVTAYVIGVYVFWKDKSGPLKPVIDWVEGIVTAVVGRVYQMIEGKPQALLAFADRLVDGGAHLLDRVLPTTIKQVCFKLYDAARSTFEVFRNDGIYGTAQGFVYTYVPVAESYAVAAYRKALMVPLVPEAVALTRFGAVKLNEVIGAVRNGGYPLASYVPLLPVDYFDRITRS